MMAMLRHRAAALETAEVQHNVPARLLYSSRRWDDVIYRAELAGLAQDDAMLTEIAWPPGERPHVFICEPSPLVEASAAALVELGHDPTLVKPERVGPPSGSARASSDDDRKD